MEHTDRAITDDHRKLVFSFMHLLRETEVKDKSLAEGVIRDLGTLFQVDPAGAGGLHDTPVDVLEAFRSALRTHERRSDVEQDEKFNTFVALLEKKGYFSGAEKDSDEYAQRLQRAREKFDKRNNPYDGLTAEQIKNKGNELMSQAKYKEAIAYYTKAIEMEPENSVFFANRAAAHTHLCNYSNAITDCERAIVLNPTYSKSYSRLGTALFYQANYDRAVEAFTKACELDPDNEIYKSDLKRAQEKASLAAPATRAAPGVPGFGPGGMPDLSFMTSMMNNPEFMSTVNNMMQNPQFSSTIANLASAFVGNNNFANPSDLFNLAQTQVDAEGNINMPFGRISRDQLATLQGELHSNPRLASVAADVQANGLEALQRHMGDPDVLNMINKFVGAFQPGTGGGGSAAQ